MPEFNLFPSELRTMSVVPRWSIINVLTRDTVSNHSYFVGVYVYSLARLIDWKGDIGRLMFRALVHDAEETICGDIPGPIKSEIIDDKRAAEFLDIKMRERLGYIVNELDRMQEHSVVQDEEAWRIVKCADRLDALIFMIMEKRLGNGVVAEHIPRSWAQTEAAFRDLPAPADVLTKLWGTVMVPAINLHETSGSMGV